MRYFGGVVLAVVGVALMGWSLAIGFFEVDVLRWVGGFVGFVTTITGVDLARATPDPWWTGGRSSFRR